MMMADRVHPKDDDSPPASGDHREMASLPVSEELAKTTGDSRNSDSPPLSAGVHRSMSQDSLMSKESYTYSDRSGPTPGTYIIQVPKDQIYRVPPPENARKYQQYTRRKHRHNQRRCCLCTTLILLLLAVLVAVSACILYLIYRPKSPSYSVQSVSVEGINLTSSTAAISPGFNVTVRAENPNKKIGIYYEKGSSFKIYHNDVEFSEGSLPAFYQPPENVTLFSTILTGSNIVLSSSARQTILTEQNSGKVPLNMHVKLPVKIKLGAVKTWTVTVKVSCAVTVSGLTANSKVVSKACDVSVKPW